MSTIQEELEIVKQWFAAPRAEAPGGYVFSEENLMALANAHPGNVSPTFDSLNSALASDAVQKANLRWEKAPWPADEYQANIKTVLRKYAPSSVKDENGFFRPGLAKKIRQLLEREYNSEYSVANIRAALFKVRPETREDLQVEQSKKLTERDMKTRGSDALQNSAISQGREQYTPEQTDTKIVESIMKEMAQLQAGGHMKHVVEMNAKIKEWKLETRSWSEIRPRFKHETEEYLAKLELDRMVNQHPPGKTVSNREMYRRRLQRAVDHGAACGMSYADICRMIKAEYDAIQEGRPPKAELIYDADHP
jgi:hypothetical protein